MSKYRQSPLPSTGFPRGIPFIVGNELAERFSFYGMKGILTIFMTKHLLDASGASVAMSAEDAKATYHLFTAAAYFFPMIGSLLSDILWGKYKTIIILSLGYCLGHACLAIMDLGPTTGAFGMKPWLFAGLLFIAVGAGGIKPCVSAHVGDQFGSTNQHLVSKMFSWFYFSINVGAMASTLLTPVLLAKVGPWAAFGLPGVLMAIATFVFWLGRNTFVHIPAAGWARFKNETLSKDGLRAVLNLAPIFLIFIPVFWALFDQTGSAWVLQATKMDLDFLGIVWYPSQVQAVNPFLILVLIPTFAYVVYPAMDRIFKMTPLRKISIGLFLTAFAFAIPGLIEANISGGEVFRSTSSTSLDSLQPVGVLDSRSADAPGWSSADAPNTDIAQELLIRLRERTAWTIDSIEIDPRTSVDSDELLMTLSHVRRDIEQLAEDSGDESRLEQFDQMVDSVEDLIDKKASLADVVSAARTTLDAIGHDASMLDFSKNGPRVVSVYAADFSDANIPALRSSLEGTKKGLLESLAEADDEDRAKLEQELSDTNAALLADADAHYAALGLSKIGVIEFAADAGPQQITFDPMKATHVLVRIESNHGGPRVKLGEVRVNTADPLPDAPARGAAEQWPNVAALGFKPNIVWQFLAYILLTAAEVLVSITSLEFAYTQAPKKMKSFIMGIYFLGISLGNLFASGVNFFIQQDDGTTKLAGASYYWFFTALMILAAVLFVIYSQFYKGKRYIQGDDDDQAATDASLAEPELAGPEGKH